MAQRKYSSEVIIHKLHKADVPLGQGNIIAEAGSSWITDQTYVRR